MTVGLKRLQNEGDLHFITFSCHDRLPYLNTPKSKQIIEDMLETLRARHDFAILGYVLMPEHVHLLMTEPKTGSVASTLRVLKGETSKLLRGTRKHFWQPRYYDFNVFTEAKRIEKLKYMHRNPVARELVARPEDWPWSSFLAYATRQPCHVTIETPSGTIPHKSGCPIHDGFIVMGGVQRPDSPTPLPHRPHKTRATPRSPSPGAPFMTASCHEWVK